MTTQFSLCGTYAITHGPTFTRLGYGAMQLAGPGVFGPPADRSEADLELPADALAELDAMTGWCGSG